VVRSVRDFIKWETNWESSLLASSGWEPSGLGSRRCEYNTRMGKFETDLLDLEGIPGRTQFKHVVFGPQAWSRDPEAYFPAIRDAIISGNETLAQLTVDKVAEILTQASANLAK
jgi:N-acetylated-alpha-linked acidic dipeptidase